MRREKLVWVGSEPPITEPDRPLPLILYPPPSISLATALETLERAGRNWRIVCTSSSFSGLNAAALAGLGITNSIWPSTIERTVPYSDRSALAPVVGNLAGRRRSHHHS
jgi:DNA-binding transcriptional LysR family regulator